MRTLGTNTKKVAHKEESYSITQGYVSDTAVAVGTAVKLNGSGGVTPVTAVTDTPIGVVTHGCRNNGDTVTVATQYVGMYKGIASGSVAIGNLLAAEEVDTATTRQKYKVAVSGNTVYAHALSAGSDGDDILVGVLRTFIVL